MSQRFSPEDLRLLEEQSILGPAPTTGGNKRTVSGSLLSPPSSGSSSHSTASTSVRLVGYQSAANTADFQLPLEAESSEALEFIGFMPETANDVFSRFVSRPDPANNPDNLLAYAIGHVKGIAYKKPLSIADASTRTGLSQDFIDVLATPKFKNIFDTETLQFWIEDTLRLRFQTILMLQARLDKIIAQAKGSKKLKRISLPPSTSTPSRSAPEHSAGRSITFNRPPENYGLPANAIISETAANTILPEHYVLYKGRSATELMGLFDEEGNIDMSVMRTHSGGDFNAHDVAYYWTPERETAEEYRKWGALRSNWAESWLLQIQLPKVWVDSLSSAELFYSADWKEYVWTCRKELPEDQIPPKYLRLLQHTNLIKGHVCGKYQIPRIKKQDVQRTISEDYLLYVDGVGKAKQWVFMGSTGRSAAMRDFMQKNMHIDVSGALYKTS